MGDLLQNLGGEMLDSYIRSYEEGRIQPCPRLRFVDREGRTCPAAAFAGAGHGAEFTASEAFVRFLGSDLEAISRRFESGELDASDLYRDCLLERARRKESSRRSVTAQATAR